VAAAATAAGDVEMTKEKKEEGAEGAAPAGKAGEKAPAKGDAKAAQEQYRATVSALDKSVQKGVLHSNTVSRYKSRLNTRLKALATAGKK